MACLFFTLIVCVSGFGGVYWDLARVEPVLGPLFFIAFQLCDLIFIILFFLANINDAYAMRARRGARLPQGEGAQGARGQEAGRVQLEEEVVMLVYNRPIRYL